MAIRHGREIAYRYHTRNVAWDPICRAPARKTLTAAPTGETKTAAGPKAAAHHPSAGRFFTVTNAATQRAAEEEVLKTCNADPTRKGLDGTCFLYAVADQVVLPQRRKEPMTPATPH